MIATGQALDRATRQSGAESNHLDPGIGSGIAAPTAVSSDANAPPDVPPKSVPQAAIVVTPHEICVRLFGIPHLILRRAEVIGVQGYIKNIGPVQPIFFIEVTTTSGEVVSDYADRSLWEEILRGLADARLFDERLGEKP